MRHSRPLLCVATSVSGELGTHSRISQSLGGRTTLSTWGNSDEHFLVLCKPSCHTGHHHPSQACSCPGPEHNLGTIAGRFVFLVIESAYVPPLP